MITYEMSIAELLNMTPKAKFGSSGFAKHPSMNVGGVVPQANIVGPITSINSSIIPSVSAHAVAPITAFTSALNPSTGSGNDIDWGTVIVGAILIGAACYGGYKLYKFYQEENRIAKE